MVVRGIGIEEGIGGKSGAKRNKGYDEYATCDDFSTLRERHDIVGGLGEFYRLGTRPLRKLTHSKKSFGQIRTLGFRFARIRICSLWDESIQG